MAEKSLHLVIRFSDNLFGVGEVIAKHNQIVDKNGYVWFGKLGSTVSSTRMDVLNRQVNDGVPTFVYLVKGNRKKSTAYRAELLSISKELPKGEGDSTPSYYSTKGLRKYMKTWVKIGKIEEVGLPAMKDLRAITSVLPIQETLVRSSSGYFLVHEAKDAF